MNEHRFSILALVSPFAFALALSIAPIDPASAQTYGTDQQQTPQAQGQFSEGDLEAFVAAIVQVNEVAEQWRPMISSAESEAKENELRGEMEEHLVKAVEDQGISVDQYNEIYEASRADPQLAQRIDEMLVDEVR